MHPKDCWNNISNLVEWGLDQISSQNDILRSRRQKEALGVYLKSKIKSSNLLPRHYKQYLQGLRHIQHLFVKPVLAY